MPRLVDTNGEPINFDDTEPSAIGDYTIDFAGNVPDGVTMVSVVWSLSIHYTQTNATPDPTPASRLQGDPAKSGTKTIQRIGNCVAGNCYLVVATATLSDGEVVPLWTTLPCFSPA